MIAVPSLVILSCSLVFSKIFNFRFVHALPAVTTLLILILHFAGIFGVLYYATYCIYVVGIFFLFGYLISNKDELVSSIQSYWQEVAFLLSIVLAFALYVQDADFHSWDEFTFWGIASKELLINHVFEHQLLPTAILDMHAHYPRGASVYHYFMLLLPGYSEGGALLAHFLLHLIFIAPLMGNKNWYQTWFIVAVIFSITVLYTTGLRAIYNDSTTGLIFASCFAIYFLEENKYRALYLILPILVFLPIFREIGLVLSLIATFIFIIDSYKLISARKALPLYAAMLVLPYLSQSLWFWHFGETHDFFGRKEHSLDNLMILVNAFNDQSTLVVINYSKSVLKFLFKEASLAIYVLVIISWWGVKKYRPDLMNGWRKTFASLVMGFVAFALWRLYLYFVAFSSAEAVKSASLLRYCGSYWFVFAIIACCYIKKSIFKGDITKFTRIGLSMLAIIASFSAVKNIMRIKHKSAPEQAVYNAYVEYAEKLIVQGIVVKLDFDNRGDAMDCYKLNYKLSPHLTKANLMNCLQAKQSFVKNTRNITVIHLPEILEDTKDVTYYPFLHQMRASSN